MLARRLPPLLEDRLERAPVLLDPSIIDDRRRKGDRAGHFLLLGSVSIDLEALAKLDPAAAS